MSAGDGRDEQSATPTATSERSRRRALAVVGILALLALAGCAAAPADQELGRENGYRYDDPVDVTPDDGLNASEQDAVVSRAMARIERIRGLEFERGVPVTVISRSAYLENQSDPDLDSNYSYWNDQVWEALFIVGEDRRFAEVQDRTLGSQVLGYYSPSREAIVLVSDADEPAVARGTLVHELVHALQDQHFGLPSGQATKDAQLAARSVVEGEANLLEDRYEARCGSTWSCVDVPSRTGGGGGTVDRGVLQVLLQPYQTGPAFVDAIQDRSGWAGVDDLHGTLPASTTQVIHPDRYPEDRPRNVSVPDRSTADWKRFDLDPVADTAGEASIFVTLWTNGALPADVDGTSYRSQASAGWAGDSLVPYRNGDRYGYVWETEWRSEADAREFLRAYERVLATHDASARGDGRYVIPETDPFGDAFRVQRDGTTVRIVNAPTVDDLAAIHDPAATG